MPYVTSWERDAKKEGIIEGIKEGKKAGKLEKAFEAAKKMMKKGFDMDTIIDITGLNRKEIEKLA